MAEFDFEDHASPKIISDISRSVIRREPAKKESDCTSKSDSFTSNIEAIREEITNKCDGLIDKIIERKNSLLQKLKELEANYDENYSCKTKEYSVLLKAKESLDNLYKDNTTDNQMYAEQFKLIEKQIDKKLSEGVNRLLSFRWNTELEKELSHLGELDLVVYDYLSKVQPVICTGDAGTSPGNLNWPRGVDVDPTSSNIYITNYKNNRIEVFSRQGNYMFNFGGANSTLKLSSPHSVCIRNDQVYILEATSKGRVLAFNLNGTFIKTSTRTFNGAGRITSTPNGELFFVTADANRILLLNGNLDYLGVFIPQTLNQPVDLKVHEDEVFILDKGDPCMHVYAIDGSFLRDIPISRGPAESGKNVINPQNFSIDPFGRFIICASNSHCVMIFSQNGNLVHKIGKEGTKIGEFRYPNSLCLDPLARIITVCERSNNELQIF